MIEEAFLQRDSVVSVERRPVRAAVHFQPLLPGRCTREALEVAARVQSLPAPVRGREQRDRDFGEIGGALAIVGTIEGPREQLLPHVFAVLLELLGRKRFGAANGIAGDAVLRAALALPVLYRLHLHFLPILAAAATRPRATGCSRSRKFRSCRLFRCTRLAPPPTRCTGGCRASPVRCCGIDIPASARRRANRRARRRSRPGPTFPDRPPPSWRTGCCCLRPRRDNRAP